VNENHHGAIGHIVEAEQVSVDVEVRHHGSHVRPTRCVEACHADLVTARDDLELRRLAFDDGPCRVPGKQAFVERDLEELLRRGNFLISSSRMCVLHHEGV